MSIQLAINIKPKNRLISTLLDSRYLPVLFSANDPHTTESGGNWRRRSGIVAALRIVGELVSLGAFCLGTLVHRQGKRQVGCLAFAGPAATMTISPEPVATSFLQKQHQIKNNKTGRLTGSLPVLPLNSWCRKWYVNRG